MTGLIQPVQQRIHMFTQVVENVSLDHPSFNQVQEFEQQAEEAFQEIEQITPILAQFQQNVGNVAQLPRKSIATMEIAEEL